MILLQFTCHFLPLPQCLLKCVQSQRGRAHPAVLFHPSVRPSLPRGHGCADVGADLAAVAGVPAVAARPVSAAAAVCHQEEAADGGNVPAQRRGEEADGSWRLGEARPAAAAAQRGASHLTQQGGAPSLLVSHFSLTTCVCARARVPVCLCFEFSFPHDLPTPSILLPHIETVYFVLVFFFSYCIVCIYT